MKRAFFLYIQMQHFVVYISCTVKIAVATPHALKNRFGWSRKWHTLQNMQRHNMCEIYALNAAGGVVGRMNIKGVVAPENAGLLCMRCDDDSSLEDIQRAATQAHAAMLKSRYMMKAAAFHANACEVYALNAAGDIVGRMGLKGAIAPPAGELQFSHCDPVVQMRDRDAFMDCAKPAIKGRYI